MAYGIKMRFRLEDANGDKIKFWRFHKRMRQRGYQWMGDLTRGGQYESANGQILVYAEKGRNNKNLIIKGIETLPTTESSEINGSLLTMAIVNSIDENWRLTERS